MTFYRLPSHAPTDEAPSPDSVVVETAPDAGGSDAAAQCPSAAVPAGRIARDVGEEIATLHVEAARWKRQGDALLYGLAAYAAELRARADECPSWEYLYSQVYRSLGDEIEQRFLGGCDGSEATGAGGADAVADGGGAQGAGVDAGGVRGAVEARRPPTCPACNGRGTVNIKNCAQQHLTLPCPHCAGQVSVPHVVALEAVPERQAYLAGVELKRGLRAYVAELRARAAEPTADEFERGYGRAEEAHAAELEARFWPLPEPSLEELQVARDQLAASRRDSGKPTATAALLAEETREHEERRAPPCPACNGRGTVSFKNCAGQHLTKPCPHCSDGKAPPLPVVVSEHVPEGQVWLVSDEELQAARDQLAASRQDSGKPTAGTIWLAEETHEERRAKGVRLTAAEFEARFPGEAIPMSAAEAEERGLPWQPYGYCTEEARALCEGLAKAGRRHEEES